MKDGILGHVHCLDVSKFLVIHFVTPEFLILVFNPISVTYLKTHKWRRMSFR